MGKQKHDYSSALKAKISKGALSERKSIRDLALEYKVPAQAILSRKKELIYSSPETFSKTAKSTEKETYLDKLNSKISDLEKEKYLYKTNLGKFGL